ncbi:hypothetical protein E5206_05415 [Arthrobacter sp. PAMC25564]|uniref:hypothetical protein n=1 Tax=Arthrobacter sp. PAMC25564 TaxID=2565366 RepID=UPI0010A285F7|nr:hypothetical protein [Arthrobacter sp. PAMC25564]QCB96433.1 hypothetical protein E5206_05415 [Arthrobacter sp. PAMC25564]
MKPARTSIIAGVVLMLAGILMLMDLLGIMNSAVLVWPLIFGVAGAAFLTLFFRRRDHWWAAIPGSVFLGVAAVILTAQLWPGPAADRAGSLLFLFMGAGFGAVFLRGHGNWWALIPCGVMLTLALIVALPGELQGMPVAAVLFLGLAATFGALSLVPVHTAHHPGAAAVQGAAVPGPPVPELPLSSTAVAPELSRPRETARMKWPLLPAGVLAALGLIFALQATVLLTTMDFVIPAVMVLAGLALLTYALRTRHGGGRKAHGS